MPNDSQELEPEPSIKEYARCHGLIDDHLQSHPLSGLPGSYDHWKQHADSYNLFQIDGKEVYVPAERITVGPEAVSFLAALVPKQVEQYPKFNADESITIHRVRNLKTELPLLHTDHGLDLLHFQQRTQLDLNNEFLPLEKVDEDAGEGLLWPLESEQLSNEIWRKTTSEKLAVSCESLLYLKRVLQYQSEGEEHKTYEDVDDEPSYQKNRACDTVTPPLLPVSPDIFPYEPSSETGHLTLFSEATSPTEEELYQAETAVFKDDVIRPMLKLEPQSCLRPEKQFHDSDSLEDAYSPLKGIKDPVSSSPQIRFHTNKCKVEVPLSPPVSDELPPWKRKNIPFKDAIEHLIPDLPLPAPASQNNSDEEIDAFFKQDIAPVAIKAKQQVEQEQLQEADATRRAIVPVMDFSRTDPPWMHHANSANSQTIIDDLLSHLERHDLRKSYWPLKGNVERELTYVAFPSSFARVETQEHIVGDGSNAEFIQQPECVDPDALIWKPDGIRILDGLVDSDEEDLDEGIFLDGNDLISLTRKRKLELEEDEHEIPAKTRGAFAQEENFWHSVPSHGSYKRENQAVFSALQSTQKSLDNTDFSALDALGDYLAIRKGDVNIVQKVVSEEARQKKLPDPSLFDLSRGNSIPTVKRIEAPPPKYSTILVPSICLPRDARQFIISTVFLQDRKLIRRILRLYPTADVVERDWTLHSQAKSGAIIKHQQTFIDCDIICNEADIIISPGTGLIVTSLQKLKQRSLPGQASHSTIRDRVSQTAPRYERLLMLVRNDLVSWAADNQEISVQDCETLADFAAFCSALSQDVSVTVISGGDEQLATWVVAMMAKHSVADWEIKLAPDETPAEMFLRRAGLNAFASQATVAAIVGTEDRTLRQEGNALSTFVRMPLHEKLARFQGLFGGDRMLMQVHSIFESCW